MALSSTMRPIATGPCGLPAAKAAGRCPAPKSSTATTIATMNIHGPACTPEPRQEPYQQADKEQPEFDFFHDAAIERGQGAVPGEIQHEFGRPPRRVHGARSGHVRRCSTSWA
jgi:hypothetical protein